MLTLYQLCYCVKIDMPNNKKTDSSEESAPVANEDSLHHSKFTESGKGGNQAVFYAIHWQKNRVICLPYTAVVELQHEQKKGTFRIVHSTGIIVEIVWDTDDPKLYLEFIRDWQQCRITNIHEYAADGSASASVSIQIYRMDKEGELQPI